MSMKRVESLDTGLSEEMKEFWTELMDIMSKTMEVPKEYLIPKTVVCPKCNEVHVLPDGKDYVICCNEVINHSNEPYD